MEKKKQGFAAIDAEQQRSIAKKGGEKVSADREHMSRIGRLGALKRNSLRKAIKDSPNI